MLHCVLDLRMLRRQVVGNAPTDDLVDEVDMLSPNGDMHAGVSLLVLGVGIQEVSGQKVFENCDVTLESIQVQQSRARLQQLALNLALKLILIALQNEHVDFVVASVDSILDGPHPLF